MDDVNFDVSDYSATTFSMDKSIWLDTIAIELIGENRVVSTHQSENPLSEMRLMLSNVIKLTRSYQKESCKAG
uniref:hypothetical protein n=1 Tax=uncultured Oscillibacter sp. TaxID=876091 RepID=UPI00272C0606